jgi:hypothetical protein
MAAAVVVFVALARAFAGGERRGRFLPAATFLAVRVRVAMATP